MPQLVPLTPERHAGKRWKRYTSYAFVRDRAIAPLTGAELARAALSLPIVFIQQGDLWFPAALLGLSPGTNLFVAPDGRWLGDYVPASFRGYPFQLLRAKDEQWVLCVDESSELIVDGADGEPFFDADNTPAPAVNQVLEFLGQVSRNRETTHKACAALARHACLKPCPVAIKTDSGGKQLGGVYQLDEAALNALDDTAFLELRRLGALPLAYFQTQSLQHLPRLTQLAEARTRTGALPVQNGDLDLSFLSQSDTLKFDF